MNNILLTAILLVNIILLVSIAVFVWKLRSTYNRLQAGFKEFITPVAEGKSSPAADMVAKLADIFAGTVLAHAQAALMGMKSGEVRADNASAIEAATSALSESNPLVGIAMNVLPKSLKNKIARNPMLLQALISRFGNKKVVAPSNHSPQMDLTTILQVTPGLATESP